MTSGLTSTVFDTSLFIPELRYRKLEPVLGEMTARAGRAGCVIAPRLLRGTLVMRERAGSTGIGKGAALPHARSVHVLEPCMVFARCSHGIDWNAPDAEAVRLVLLMLSPAEATAEMHVEWIARGAAILRLQRLRQRLLDAERFETVAAVFAEALA
jgi:mannitol/fructose-specific phosphotransferase system IIA component (Ntr-type)